jgi:hypothetical protein
VPGVRDNSSRTYHLTFQNLSAAVAVKPVFEILVGDNTHSLPSVLGKEVARLNLSWAIAPHDIPLQWKLSYSVIEGHRFEVYGELTIKNSHQDVAAISFNRTGLRYAGSDPSLLLTSE